MTLGIKLEIDQGSVKKASDSIRQAAEKSVASEKKKALVDKEKKRIRKEQGIKDPKDKNGGAFGGAAIGGFVGALIGSLDSIQEILGVIGSILKIALVPILILMKPFLIVLLKAALLFLKIFSGNKRAAGDFEAGTAPTGGEIEGSAGEAVTGLRDKFFGWLEAVFDPTKASSMFGVLFSVFAGTFFAGLGDIFFGFLDIIGGVWDFFVGLLTGNLDQAAQGIFKVFAGIWNIFVGIFKVIIGLFGTIFILVKGARDLIQNGLKALGNIGLFIFDKIKQVISSSLKVLRNIGSFIKDAILGFFGGGGGKTTSVNDALITSGGDIVKFNPNDNIMAFQDFSTLDKAGGSGGGNNITIHVDGFVGSEEELADRIGKALNNSSRGSTSNYS